ncbi:MAG: hypothetical protein IJZ69_04295 [Bacteroidales bacterium]|nr:hypothetical protein [Bacteroidales bacterium]MBQ8809534.1 hypothetical protein [Bacteroidales bacterium]
MCSGLMGGSKAPKAVTYAPSATVMNSDVADKSAQGDANERERKKRGYNSTRSGMANILAGVGTKKDTLG